MIECDSFNMTLQSKLYEFLSSENSHFQGSAAQGGCLKEGYYENTWCFIVQENGAKKQGVWGVTELVLGRNALKFKLSLCALKERVFLEPHRKQREEQESAAEIPECLTDKGMVAPRVVSAFQPLGKIPAQDLSGTCFKSLPSALKGYRYLPLVGCAEVCGSKASTGIFLQVWLSKFQ